MSSHREAPEISKDPVADSTDLYAFVTPDGSGTATLIANYVPLQGPDAGPNFFEFGDDVLYEIHVDNNGDALPDVTYQFRFTTVVGNPDTFLYNTGPILLSGGQFTNWNRRQFYSVTVVRGGVSTLLAEGLACPPCNIGPLSTPDYASGTTSPDPLTAACIFALPGGRRVFAGQRAEGFYVDLGAIFDLGDLRPFENLHNTFGLPALAAMPGVNSGKALNVHSIALQVPLQDLTASRAVPTDPSKTSSVVGVWTTASRQRVRLLFTQTRPGMQVGPWAQVSRLGNPLVNEVLIPMARKDMWNSLPPSSDKEFLEYVLDPELARLLPILYHAPGSADTLFPHLQALNTAVAAGSKSRADLEAILMTGIPTGIIGGFQNFTGPVPADMLRLNLAIPPTTSGASNLGLVGGDPAGFPNGRRVFDDVTTIELRAIAGATYPLVDGSFTPDAAAGLVTDGLTASPTDTTANGTVQYLSSFPFLGTPHSGYANPAS